MERFVAIALVLSMGCGASAPVVRYSGVAEKQHVETRELPAAPDAEPIPKEGDWVKPLPAGQAHDQGGVLLSPEKAARAKKWQDGYKNLRSLYELDRQIWGEHRVIYEERLRLANKEVERNAPTWWSENKGTLGWALGFIAGAAATIGIVYAVDEVKQ